MHAVMYKGALLAILLFAVNDLSSVWAADHNLSFLPELSPRLLWHVLLFPEIFRKSARGQEEWRQLQVGQIHEPCHRDRVSVLSHPV